MTTNTRTRITLDEALDTVPSAKVRAEIKMVLDRCRATGAYTIRSGVHIGFTNAAGESVCYLKKSHSHITVTARSEDSCRDLPGTEGSTTSEPDGWDVTLGKGKNEAAIRSHGLGGTRITRYPGQPAEAPAVIRSCPTCYLVFTTVSRICPNCD